jgi:hypothetical protein
LEGLGGFGAFAADFWRNFGWILGVYLVRTAHWLVVWSCFGAFAADFWRNFGWILGVYLVRTAHWLVVWSCFGAFAADFSVSSVDLRDQSISVDFWVCGIIRGVGPG